ncbi:SUMF1/EgtB/PvdO family nonheme iron enzyme [Candidatus Albibeggiatoa sp. nov. NOAA]|uniref:formylglycine-generating enzyme family protein n=1 Tax=Candidatus Albibeggiatoa sp. nov. NOAA TaxID=3162724 RepID=UPI003303DBFD|nr:SUMF1/EgtB/PvdO family nonheme iron enzyme [Thiotrichaceae bacterium]
MSSIVQAKAEAQKLIKRYNKLQAEAKSADSTEEAARKATEAEKLVSQISALQTAITKLQARDREQSSKEARKPATDKTTAPKRKTSVLATADGVPLASEEELRRAEAEKIELESRIGRIEAAQRKTREQIDQLARAKRELARLKSQAEKSARERRESDEKLQQELARRIKQKEDEHLRLKKELDSARAQAQKDAELLRLQRDSARAMMERQQQLERDKTLGKLRRSGTNGLVSILIGAGVTLLLVAIVVVLAVTTPIFDSFIGDLKHPPVVQQPLAQPRPTITQIESNPKPEAPKQLPKPRVKPLAVFRDNLKRGGFGPTMLKLPEGSFLLGVKNTLPYQEERPQTDVSLQSFSISRYEVTFDEYDAFASNTNRKLPSDKGWGRGKRPVINISWHDAVDYTKWLTEQTGKTYRLPSEREWEYAAAAGVNTPYWWGRDLGRNKANCAVCGSQWDAKQTAPVGSFPSNNFGLHDTIGNVMEWTMTCFRPSYRGAPSHGQIWEGGDCSRRIVRGSSYRTYENSLRMTKRHNYSPRTRMDTLGFRVVRLGD